MSWIFDSESGEFNPKYVSILRALPDASEEQRAIIEAVLSGARCKDCERVTEGRDGYVCCNYGFPVDPDHFCKDFSDTEPSRCEVRGGKGWKVYPGTISGIEGRRNSCPSCHGTGWELGSRTTDPRKAGDVCPSCRGSGVNENTNTCEEVEKP